MIPAFAIMQIEAPHFHTPRLWLPLFLLWIPLLLVLPLILLVLLGLCIAGRISFWHTVSVFWGIASSLHGTHVHVSTGDAKVLVRIV
jgi:hypothetical protein